MQVFMPYANPIKTAKCLDNLRLNKQILETLQILSANTRIDIGWKMPKYIHNHPTTKLWQFHEYYLLKYLRHLLNEFMDRTNKYHSCEKQYKIVFNKIAYLTYIPEEMNFLTPEFCKKHQQILLEKDFNHYKQYFIYGYIQEKNNKKA